MNLRNEYIDISNYQFRDEKLELGQKPFITKFKPVEIKDVHDKEFDLFLRKQKNKITKENQ